MQRKILAGEARLVRMVAHPHIVRCHQVLETRRQQVRPGCGAVGVQLAGGAVCGNVSTDSFSEAVDAAAATPLCRIVPLVCHCSSMCPSFTAGAGAGAPVWGRDAEAAAAHEAIQRGKRLPAVQAGGGESDTAVGWGGNRAWNTYCMTGCLSSGP